MMIKIVPSSPSLKISTMFLVFLIILLMPPLTVFADSHQYFSPFIIDTVNTSKSANAHIDKHNQLDLNELIQPSILTFFNSESSLQVDSTSVWPPFMSRSLYMKFRTDRPNGLLFFHIVDSAPQGYPVYEFYMMLERGNIKVIHEFGMASDIFTLGRSLNNDQWHEVNITITVERPQLMMIVDDQAPSIFDLKDFANRYPQRYKPYSDGIQSTIFFGGIYPKFRPAHQHHTIARFIGCMGNIIFEHETILFALPPEVRQSGLKKGCYNACASGTVCSLGAPCINHYTHATCDCFASESEDDWCSTKTLTSVTFHGSSFITYKAFNWTQGSEALFNRLSVHFKTIFDTSLLLYAYGLYPRFNQLNLALISGQIRFEIDFGEGPLRIAPDTVGLNDDQWHNVTILHSRQNVTLLLDGHAYPLIVTGIHHLHLEPFIYVGGLPASVGGKSNLSENIVKQKFVGCLRGVYFNRADIIYRLKRKSPSIRYTGLFQPEFGCSPVHSLPITLQTSWSYLNITKTRRKEELDVILEIKTNQTNVVMGSGVLQYGNNTDSRWILHLNNSMPQFSIILGSEEEKPQSMIVTAQDSSSSTYTLGQWNMISVEGYGGNLTLKVGDSYSIDLVYKEKIHFDPNIIIGALNSTFPNSTRFGLGIMGCIRNVNVDGRFIDPRVIMDDPSMHRGRISLDECTLVNPCNYPSACEHNGRCTVNRQGEAACDCTDTGYAGKTCHFALYKRTCEEYYLVGHRKNGTYTIDIDRNGPLPPANVDCTMSPHRKETTIRHNIPVEYIVRKSGLPDFYITVQYREFTKEMLKALISHTKGCSQEIKYGCKRAPFGLSGQTWMISATDRRVDSLGSDLSGRCPCSTAANCRNRDLHCNCDESSDLEGEDSGVISDPNRLGVHRVYFKQPPNLTLQSEGRFTLSPLKCLDLSTQEHNITFKTKDSFLQLDGWFKGDLAFSFRTTLAEGILLYQAPLFPHHGYFRVSIINEFEMLFEYSVNGIPRQSTVISHRKLNSGEWQQVWIDYETRHMRFTVNLDSFMIDLDVDQEFDPFEGPLYIGGAPKSKLTGSSLKGFTGCFRGLLIDDQIIPLRIPDTVKGVEVHCQESCRPNPCFNSGKCIEMWGNYECKCSNPLTQSGKRCEQDLNEKAITLASNDAYIHIRWTRQPIHHPVLQKDILMSFKTYEKKGLLLYSNDHLNNFVQIHINGTAVTLTFNTKRKVVSGSVDIGPELSKGELIQLQINRSPSKTILNVYTNCKVGCTNHSVIIEAPVSILSEYYQSPWTNGAHLELVRPFRYFLAVQPHTQLFIGGVHPAVNHSIPSFVGCISGLKIDDNVVNLPDLINQKRLDLTVSGNISRGCNRKCDQNPCENGGICLEDLRINGTEGVFCDCMATSYRGKRCDSDVGLKFYGSSVLKYNLSSYSNVSLETFSIEFAFSAEPEFYPLLSGIKRLIFAFYYGNHTFTVALLASGGLQFLEEDKTGRGWKKVVQPIQSNLADGYRHWAIYTRKQNLTILQIDGGQAMPLLPLDINSKTAKNKTERRYIKIGGSLDNPDDLKDFKTYIGCLSNLQVKFGKNLENIINPIDAAFDGDQNVDVISNGTTTEEGMNQRRCSKFKPVSKISSNSRNLILSSGLSEKKWSPSEPLRYQLLYATRPKGPMDIRSHEFYVAIVCVIFLGFVILFVAIYMFRIQRNYKLRKFHHDTPFFNSQRSFDRVYQEDRASSTAASLLKFQPDDSSRASELQILYSNGGDDSDYDSIPVSQRISSSIQLMEKHPPRRSK